MESNSKTISVNTTGRNSDNSTGNISIEGDNRARSKGNHDPKGSAAAGETLTVATIAQGVGAAAAIERGVGGQGGREALPVGSGTGVEVRGDGDEEDEKTNAAVFRIDPKLESDLLKLFGQADQVDAAFKVG